MVRAHERQRVQIVELIPFQRQRRDVLQHVERRCSVRVFLSVWFQQPHGGQTVVVGVLDRKTLRVSVFIPRDGLVGRQDLNIVSCGNLVHSDAGPGNPGDVLCRNTGCERFRDIQDRPFAHAVHQNIRLRIQQDGAAHFVFPVVVVPQTAQARLQPADHDGYVFIGLSGAVAVHDDRPVRPVAVPAARAVDILGAAVFENRVVVDHAVDVPAVDEEAEPRSSETPEVFGAVPVRLRQDRHFIPVAFQQAADDGGTKRRVIHIGIPRHQDEIDLIPAALFHIRSCNRQKVIHGLIVP